MARRKEWTTRELLALAPIQAGTLFGFAYLIFTLTKHPLWNAIPYASVGFGMVWVPFYLCWLLREKRNLKGLS